MALRLYRPTWRKAAWFAAVGFAGLGCAFYLRYRVIEQASIGIACESADTWLCAVRRTTIALYRPSAFGLAALSAALLNLVRPSAVLWTFALLAAGLGLVLYNATWSALAVGLLILSLARRAPGQA
jgi:hypothetical protein